MLGYLLASGADRARRTGNGYTTLLAAIESGDVALVADLIDEGAAPDESLPDGWTPLMAAAARGQPDIVRELLSVGADPIAGRSRPGRRCSPPSNKATRKWCRRYWPAAPTPMRRPGMG